MKVKKLAKCHVMTFFDTGIEMQIEEEDKSTRTYTFSGFENREDVFEGLESIWQAQSPHAEQNHEPEDKKKVEDKKDSDSAMHSAQDGQAVALETVPPTTKLTQRHTGSPKPGPTEEAKELELEDKQDSQLKHLQRMINTD